VRNKQYRQKFNRLHLILCVLTTLKKKNQVQLMLTFDQRN